MLKRHWQNIRQRNGCFQNRHSILQYEASNTTLCNAKYVHIS